MRRGKLRLGLIVGALVLVAAFQTTIADATKYENAEHHYSIDAPAGWIQVLPPPPAADVAFRSPNSGQEAAFEAAGINDQAAENTSVYVLGEADKVDQYYISQGATEISPPQAKTLGGRPVADFTVQYSNATASYTVRWTILASVFHHIEYIVVFSARSDAFGSLDVAWNAIANSFRVLDEPGTPIIFNSPQRHYAITAPVGWTQGTEVAGIDVSFESPNLSDLASFLVVSVQSSSAENTSAFVLKKAQDLEQTYEGPAYAVLMHAKVATIANRPAAEFEVLDSTGPTNVTSRWGVFASTFYRTTYAVELTARSDRFDSFNSTWDAIVSSFRLSGEEAATVGGNNLFDLLALAGRLAILVVVVIIALVVVLRRRRAKSVPATQTMPPPMPSSAPVVLPPAGPITDPHVRSIGSAPVNPPAAVRLAPENLSVLTRAEPTPAAQAAGSSATRRFCIRCGSPLPEGAAFCGACGAKLE